MDEARELTERDGRGGQPSRMDQRDMPGLIQAPFEQAEVGMFQIDAQGDLTRVSTRFCEMTRRVGSTCLGTPFVSILLAEDVPVFEGMLRQVLAEGPQSMMRQFRLDMRGAPDIWVNCTLSVVRDATGALLHVFGVLKDITAVKLAEEAFARQHALFSRISQNSPVGLVHLEPAGTIGFANHEANRIFGLAGLGDAEEQKRFRAIRWQPAGDTKSLEQGFAAQPERFAIPGVFCIVLPDGRSRHVSVRASRLALDEDLLEGAVLVVEDVSAKIRAEAERERLNQELARTVAELERSNAQLQEEIREHRQTEMLLEASRKEAIEANEAKSLFLANMSHEIRTPMNGLLGLTDLLLMSEENPDRKESLELISLSGRNLLRILNDILDYSRLEAGGMSIVPAPFALRGLLRELAGVFAPQAAQKGLRLEMMDETGDLERIVGDVERIRQILINLMSNAIKFTDDGEIRLHVQQTGPDREPRLLQFCVQDTGIGISESERAHLFERFRQLDGTRTRRYGGTGLGLAISKLLTERMGGRIWLDESYTGGCRFCIQLPISTQAGTDSGHTTMTDSPQQADTPQQADAPQQTGAPQQAGGQQQAGAQRQTDTRSTQQ